MYSLVKRQAEVELLPMALSENIKVALYLPLGNGLQPENTLQAAQDVYYQTNAMRHIMVSPECMRQQQLLRHVHAKWE